MASLAMDNSGPVAYTDLRLLIDIDPPQYEDLADLDTMETQQAKYVYGVRG